MDARFYNSDDIDIERLAKDLVNAYLSQGYQAQNVGNKDQTMVQLKKGGDLEAIIGMQAALSLNIQRTTGGVLATIGQQRWIDKAAVGAVGVVALPFLWPLALTAGVGALRQASLGNQVLNMVDGLARQQKPDIAVGPVPYNLMPQVQQHWTPPTNQPPYYTPGTPPTSQPPYYTPGTPPTPPRPISMAASAPGGLRCGSCNTPYEPGDTFCSGCGQALTQPHLYCSKCNSEIKQGASFCPRCGSSTFHTLMSPPVPTPAPTSTPKVTYVPAQPTYTPPAPSKPSTPVYTPPPQKPPTPAYVPPQQAKLPVPPVYTPPIPPKPIEPAYVAPITQTPDVQPQPKVTYTPAQTGKPAQPSAPAAPEKQYYIPSNQVAQEHIQQTTPGEQPEAASLHSAPTVPAIPAKPVATPPPVSYYMPSTQAAQEQFQAAQAQQPQPVAIDKGAPWGRLAFSDGKQMELTGDHAMVGRYDHDMGGIEPEVDLAKMPNADTVSRIHAVIEFVGDAFTLTDLNSTNLTRLNNKRLEPDKAVPLKDGDSIQFGKVTCTFKKL